MSSDPDSAIKILGAGPAGLSAAIVLAQHGRQVEVFERRRWAGARFHDDYQGLENWSTKQDVLRELEAAGVSLDFECRPFRGGTIYNPRLRPAQVVSPVPLFYLVRRGNLPGSLDSGLTHQAAELGVRLHFNTTLAPEAADIVAGGPRTARAVALGMNFETDWPDAAHAIVKESLAPGGYTYLLVGASKATLATVLYRDFRAARQYLDRTVQTYQRLLGLKIKHPKPWGGYVDFGFSGTALRDGKPHVGEAAGFQDLLFGFGIRIAMLSGILAARSILSGENYDRLWKRRLRSMLLSSRINRAVYSALRGLAYNGLWFALKESGHPERVMRLLYNWLGVALGPGRALAAPR